MTNRGDVVKVEGAARFRQAYLVLWIVILEALVALNLLALAWGGRDVRAWMVLFLIPVCAPIAQWFGTTLLGLFTPPHDLPKVRQLKTRPRVALLYCACDDVVEACLQRLGSQTYSRCTAFVLDDSRSERYRRLVDRAGYQVLRRGTREGYKAGNLNNWLREHGDTFDYFVILDADSVLPPNFVEQMLLYAEHPANGGVAMLESKIVPYQPEARLSRALAVQARIGLHLAERLNNRLGITLSNGHNNLCRTRTIQEAGGFDERFVSEDHATALNLLVRDYVCRLVDVYSYEVGPQDISAYVRRAARWTRSDLQLLGHRWLCAPLTLQLNLFLRSLGRLTGCLYLLGMFYVTWGLNSSWQELGACAAYYIAGAVQRNGRVVCFLSLFAIYFAYAFVSGWSIALRAKVPTGAYIWSTIHQTCLNYASIPPQLVALAKTCIGRPFRFEPTPKASGLTSPRAHWRTVGPLCLLSGAIALGVLRNPVALLFNWVWIIPLVAAPWVLWEVSGS